MDITTSTAKADERVTQNLRRMVDDAEQLLKSTAEAGDEHLDAARERLRKEVSQLRVQLSDLEHRAASRLRETAHATDQVVHQHPYSAMGIAALAGVLLGFVLGRR
jgi:ElaB/YqjD/DUF883 family membrane-anchored ribosome-binding protein